MRKLLPLGVIEEPHLPVYLTSWVDKTSPLHVYYDLDMHLVKCTFEGRLLVH
jgi:hypothetical protein